MALTEKLSLVIDSVGFGRAGAEFRKLSADIDKAGKSSASTADYMRALGPAAVLAGGAVAAGMGVAVAATLNFDKTMSKVRAVTDASAKDMAKLRDAAIDAGRATVFSAADAAKAQAELAKAGISTADILGGGLRGALDLAASGELALADAATIAAQAMNVFGLRGSDVGGIADALTAGANKSAASVASLGEGLSNVGPVAKNFGLSLKDTVAILAMFEDRGIRGAEAGTALRSLFMRLSKDSKEAATAMDELGLEVYDSSGAFVGAEKFAGNLQVALSGLTQEQRALKVATIFGTYAQNAANILAEQGAEGFADYRDAVDDAGAASRIAGIQLDNLAGDLENLKGSIETALIQGGSKATGALRFLAQDAATAVNAFSGLPDPVQTAGVAIAGLGSFALISAGAIGVMLPKLRATQDALSAMGPAGVSAARGLGLLAKGSGVAVGVVALAEGVHFLANELDEMVRGAPKIGELAGALAELASSANKPIAPVFELSRGDLGDIPELLDNINAADRRLSQGAKSGLKNKLDDIDKALATLAGKGGAPEAAKQALDRLAGTLDVSPTALLAGLDDYNRVLRENAAAAKVSAAASLETAGGVEKVGSAAGGASGPVGDVASATDDLADAADEAEDKLKNLRDSMDKLIGIHVDAITAESNYQEAIDAVTEAFADQAKAGGKVDTASPAELADAQLDVEEATKKAAEAAAHYGSGSLEARKASVALQKAQERLVKLQSQGVATASAEEAARIRSARALDLNTEAGRKAKGVLGDLIEAGLDRVEAMAREGKSMDELKVAFDQQVSDFKRVAKEAGLTDDQINTLLTTYGLTPDNVTTIVNQVGAEQAAAAIGTIESSADKAAKVVREQLNPALQTTYDKLLAMGGLFALIAQVAAGGGGTAGAKTPGIKGLEDYISGKKAKGGDVDPNGLYLVGEEGPELLKMGANGGYVYPNDVYEKMRGSLSVEARAAGGYVGRPRLYGQAGPIVGGKSETQNIMPNANIVIQPQNFDAFVRDTERQARLAALAGI